MKKTYKKLGAFIGLLGMMAFSANAQLNGTVTINSGAATVSGSNYQSWNDFATDINTQGVNGMLTVNVVANTGPYIEQVSFNQITGMTAANRVVINGNGTTLQFNSTNAAAPHTLRLNGTDYMTVNNLNVIGQGSTYAMVVVLTNNANRNNFNNCTFTAPQNGTNSYQCPFTIGSTTHPTNGGNAGDYNTITTCTMSNGYYGFVSYGLTSAPWTKFNSIINCRITDFYYYGVYFYYNQNFTMQNCVVDRVTRTSTTTMYAFYAYFTNNTMMDGNKFHKLYDGTPGSTSTLYFYMAYQAQPGVGRNTYRNNIITDIKHNGTMYMYQYYGGWDIYNNTFDWDWAGGNHTGTLYNNYHYSNSSYGPSNYYNNIISLRKPGSGTRYGFYNGSTPGFTTYDKNNTIVGTGTGNNYIGFWTSNATTLAQWQAQGMDLNGWAVDPQYANQAAGDLHPTNAAINNMAAPMGLIFDQELAVRNQTTPDIGALEFLTPQCTGTPPSNTVTAPNYAICPGEDVALGLSFLNPDKGFTYQWQVSTTSNVGPFTNVPGANGLFYTAPNVGQNTWYSVVMTCTAPGGTSIAPVGYVQVAGPSQSVVPYHENFEGIGKNNRLPNCSWAASSLGNSQETYISSQSNNRVPRSGTSFATFNNSTPGTNYYYTEPIQMNANITYSAAVWYATEYFGYNNWTSLSIMVGPNQSTTGMVQVATVNPAVSGPYKLLDNTFTVPTSGQYYVAIKAVSTAGNAMYLMIDDLSITIPCGPTSPNSPTLSLGPVTNTICAGDPVNLTAAGADTYLWSTGDQVAAIAPTPMSTTNYTVWGTNALTGCTAELTQLIYVNPAPNLFVVASNPVICAGEQAVLTAFGASSYVWAVTGNNTGQSITVSPAVTTQYVVNGSNQFNCSASYTQAVTVKPAPTLTVMSSNDNACKDDQLSLTAFGGTSYQWISNNSPNVYQGPIINIQVTTSSVFTITAMGANGCAGKATLNQNISECTGIAKNAAVNGMMLYPNPTSGEFTIELNNNAEKNIEVTDVTGRVIVSTSTVSETVNINLSNLASGVYYVKVQSENANKVVKVVKQ